VVAYCVGGRPRSASDVEVRRAGPQKLLGALALACIAAACGYTLYANLAADRADAVLTAPAVTVVTARPAEPTASVEPARPLARVKPGYLTAPTFSVALLDTAPSGLPASEFSRTPPPAPRIHTFQLATVAPARPAPALQQVALSIPVPAPRPAGLAPRPAELALPQVHDPSLDAMAQKKLATAADNPFDTIFGRRDTDQNLAYAPADSGVFNDGQSKSPGRLPRTDNLTAVYDISARTVYMPDGSRLEAHSGLRDKLDDPRYVHVRMHGATPPHTYDLVPRESLFHRIEALRMIPVGGEAEIFGRSGILAHSYMLGPNGDSNGCVSFRDYDAFLRAYQRGRVKRLVVVASGGRSMLASSN
jgi:hypothetical protein